MRYDIISDTHRYLSDELLAALDGCDMIVHAGDICSTRDYFRLQEIAPLMMCLGNNDYASDYGKEVTRVKSFEREGISWQICHYRERINLMLCDIAVFGHTHRPVLERMGGKILMNPGSPSLPRGCKPSMGRIIVEDKKVVSAEIIEL